MIDAHDIDALKDDEALSRASERLKGGTTSLREAPAGDVQGIIRAGIMWRNIAIGLWTDTQARQKDAMSVGEKE